MVSAASAPDHQSHTPGSSCRVNATVPVKTRLTLGSSVIPCIARVLSSGMTTSPRYQVPHWRNDASFPIAIFNQYNVRNQIQTVDVRLKDIHMKVTLARLAAPTISRKGFGFGTPTTTPPNPNSRITVRNTRFWPADGSPALRSTETSIRPSWTDWKWRVFRRQLTWDALQCSLSGAVQVYNDRKTSAPSAS
jgi:hypothetical protein